MLTQEKKWTQLLHQIQLEEVFQKLQWKERRLELYYGRIRQYRQNKALQNNVRNFYP